MKSEEGKILEGKRGKGSRQRKRERQMTEEGVHVRRKGEERKRYAERKTMKRKEEAKGILWIKKKL